MMGISEKDLLICFICSELDARDNVLRCQKGRPDEDLLINLTRMNKRHPVDDHLVESLGFWF